MTTEATSAGDEIPNGSEIIEIRIGELRQLFNAIDPSPFRERDLDPKAEEFIVDWGRELPGDARLALRVHLDRPPGPPSEATELAEAVHEYFGQRALASRRNLRALLRRGRTALVIGLAFLAGVIAVGDAITSVFNESDFAILVRESLIIGGWVAMWGPLEIFLYEWWPIRAEARLFDRLSAMPVRINYAASPRTG